MGVEVVDRRVQRGERLIARDLRLGCVERRRERAQGALLIEALTARPYTNNSFGSIGLTLYPPAPALLAVASSEWRFEAGQAFHSYAKVDTMFFSETILVTDTGYERLTCMPRELVVTTE